MDKKIDGDSISSFNEAAFQITRLHGCWTLANSYSRKGKLNAWKWILDVIWRELYANAKRNTNWEEIKKSIKEIDTKIARNQFERNKLYKYLIEKEEFLRELQDKVGKGSSYNDDLDSMID